MIMLESLKAFAATEPQQEKIRDEYTLDEVSFKRMFRQIFTLADRYKDVPTTTGEDYSEEYWKSIAQDIGTIADDWKLHDAEGREIIDQATGACKFHPLFMNMITGVMTGYEEVWKARRS